MLEIAKVTSAIVKIQQKLYLLVEIIRQLISRIIRESAMQEVTFYMKKSMECFPLQEV